MDKGITANKKINRKNTKKIYSGFYPKESNFFSSILEKLIVKSGLVKRKSNSNPQLVLIKSFNVDAL